MPRYDSDSDSSHRSRSRKKPKKKSRKRSNSSSSSSLSDSSVSEKAKPRRYCLHSRSRSRSRDRNRRRKHSSRSPSSKKSHRRHQKRRSSSRTKRKYVSRSSSRGHHSYKSRSCSPSDSRNRHSKVSQSSRSGSPSQRRSKMTKDKDIKSKILTEDELMRTKLEAVLKAAADADAQLREKGLLPESSQKPPLLAPPEMSVNQQIKMAQAIEDIKSAPFIQQDFTSSRHWNQASEKKIDLDAVNNTVMTSDKCALTKIDDWRENAEKLVDPNLFKDPEMQLDRWKKKLASLRSIKFNGNSQV